MHNFLTDLAPGDVVECTFDNPWALPHVRKGHLFYVAERDGDMITYQRCRELKRSPGILRLSRADWAHGITDVAAFECAYFTIRRRNAPRPVPHVIKFETALDQFA